MPTRTENEAARMQRVPGIVFGGSPDRREPWIAGTGIDVAEIICAYRAVNQDMDLLRATFEWLTEEQLQAAFEYYAAYAVEIDARIAESEGFSIEQLWADYPQ